MQREERFHPRGSSAEQAPGFRNSCRGWKSFEFANRVRLIFGQRQTTPDRGLTSNGLDLALVRCFRSLMYTGRTIRSLDSRLDYLHRSNFRTYRAEVGTFWDFVQDTPPLRAIADAIDRKTSQLDPQAWIDEHFGTRGCTWPRTELEQIRIRQHLIARWAGGWDPEHVGQQLTTDHNYEAMIHSLQEIVVDRYAGFLRERLEACGEVTHLLARYAARVMWWDSDRLRAEMSDAAGKRESVLDRDLRRFLFDSGIDYPISQAVSPSGRADILAALDTDDPLVIEVKIYDAVTYRVPRIAGGVKQALRYAQDHGKGECYVVVFNASDEDLDLPTDDAVATWPPVLRVAGVSVFIATVPLRAAEPASTAGKTRSRRVSRDDLVGGETAE